MADVGIAPEVQALIVEHIDSVMQLELLLLTLAQRNRRFTAAQLAGELRIDPVWVEIQLKAMAATGFLECVDGACAQYGYAPRTPELDRAVSNLASAYADRRVTVIGLIFSKPVDKLRSFADAFRLRKETRPMAEAVYVLCAATCVACAVLLFRGYRRSDAWLLLWSSLCFIGLAANNVLLFVDKVVLPQQDGLFGIQFTVLRTAAALAGLVLLLYGLIWDADDAALRLARFERSMNQALLNHFLLGCIVLACGVAGLFFLRFWRKTRDRLFAIFAIAFWTLGLNWLALAFTNQDEVRTVLYVVRLLAFLLILFGILDKNRAGRGPRG